MAVRAMATYTPVVVTADFAAPASTMTVEIAPGPASIGTPRGMIPTSSFSIPSAFSTGVSFCWLRRAWTMSSAFRPISTPPAILKAPSVMPKSRKMRLPPSANAVSVMAQVQAPRRAMSRRTSGVSRAVIARNVGTAVSGSTMNRTDVKMMNSSCSVFTIASHRDLHDAVLAGTLRFVHRLVGLADQLVGAGFRARYRHHADARRHGGGAPEHRAHAGHQPR